MSKPTIYDTVAAINAKLDTIRQQVLANVQAGITDDDEAEALAKLDLALGHLMQEYGLEATDAALDVLVRDLKAGN